MSTEMFKAADLNLTFDDSEVKAGDADVNGNFDGNFDGNFVRNFDGVYGILQRNESDFQHSH